MVFLINCRNHLSQEHLNGFLSDLNITDCKLGSKLADLKANEKIKNDLSFIFVSDSLNLYQLKNQNINLYNLDTVDIVLLNFRKDSLQSILVEVSCDLNDGKFEKTYNLLKSKYGEPKSNPLKSGLFKIYTWIDGKERLMLKPVVTSFIMKYYIK